MYSNFLFIFISIYTTHLHSSSKWRLPYSDEATVIARSQCQGRNQDLWKWLPMPTEWIEVNDWTYYLPCIPLCILPLSHGKRVALLIQLHLFRAAACSSRSCLIPSAANHTTCLPRSDILHRFWHSIWIAYCWLLDCFRSLFYDTMLLAHASVALKLTEPYLL